MNVLIAGLPRSGTTLLANLMTNVEEKRWVMTEPLFNHKSCTLKPRLMEQVKLFEGFMPSVSNLAGAVNDFNSYFTQWGAKEVFPARYKMLYEALNPDKVIILSRDLEDVLKSSYRFTKKRSIKVMTLEKRSKIIQAFTDFSDSIPEDKKIIVKYEDLFNPDCRAKLGDTLNWALDGDTNFGMDRYNRGDEKREGIQKRKIEEIEYPKVISEILEYNKSYQEKFEYGR